MKYLLFVLFISLGFSQTSQDIIYWSENSRLEWKDFKARPENHPTHKAMSNLGLSVSMDVFQDSLNFISRTTFDRTRSWVKEGWEVPRTLDHEQIHFDIRELHCRKIKKAIMERRLFKRKTIQLEINNIIKVANIQNSIDQALFDKESYPSVDKQNEWKTKVELELRSLTDFQGPIVKVILTN